jgi:Protein of unknown function (DUF3485)
MNLKPLFLPIIIGLGLSLVYILPQAGSVANSAVRMDLPKGFGAWSLNSIPASKSEIETLGADTKFSKAECFAERPDEYDSKGNPVPDYVNLSIVLSGYDLNSSIHRPERCMPAQGHQILGSSDVRIELSNGHQFEVKRLKSVRRVSNEKSAESKEWKCITYYFFIGHEQITNDHLTRTFLDMKDRLVKGMDQRWAYVSASIYYGDVEWIRAREVTEEEADDKLRNFISELAKRQIEWNQISQ